MEENLSETAVGKLVWSSLWLVIYVSISDWLHILMLSLGDTKTSKQRMRTDLRTGLTGGKPAKLGQFNRIRHFEVSVEAI